MPRKRGTAPIRKVLHTFSSHVRDELVWFSQNMGIVWSSTASYLLEDFRHMEFLPYKEVTYTLPGKGPDGERAKAVITVNFEDRSPGIAGYSEKGEPYALVGIYPQVAVPVKPRWVIRDSHIIVEIEDIKTDRYAFEREQAAIENLRERSLPVRLIEEEDWN